MVQRGMASRIPFEMGPQIGDAIPAMSGSYALFFFRDRKRPAWSLGKTNIAKVHGFLFVVFQWTVSKNLTIILAHTPERTILMTSSLLLYILRCHLESAPGPLANLRSFSRAKLKQWICHCLSFREWVIRDSRALGERKNRTSVFFFFFFFGHIITKLRNGRLVMNVRKFRDITLLMALDVVRWWKYAQWL